MKKKMVIFCLVFLILFVSKSFAKYKIQDTLMIPIAIDKTLPIVDVICNETKETFAESKIDDSVKKNNDITIETRDNTKVESNEYYFNPSEPNFEGLNSTDFESGDTFTEEGYYKIVVTDASRNKIEIVILLDKTAPDILVEYFKMENASAFFNQNETIRQIVGIQKHAMTENCLETDTEEVENVVENVEQGENEIKEETQGNTIENTQVNETNVEIAEDNQEEVKEEKEQQNVIKSEKVEEAIIEQEENNVEYIEESQIMPLAISDMYVGNEAEFRNALANQAQVIHVRQSIDFASPVIINYAVEVVGDGTSNSLRYGKSGNFIVVQKNATLVMNRIVVDTNSSGISGITAINIELGGNVTFRDSSIVDGGTSNIGILVNDGATLLLWSSEIVRCNCGILLKSNGGLNFATQDGRANSFYWNNTAVLIENFSGNCNFNQNIVMHDNTIGIYTKKVTGTVKISSGNYYNNEKAVQCGGSITVSGGEFYKNTHGIYTGNTYSGNLTISNCKIYSNTKYAIYHNKTNDGGCIILRRKYSWCDFFGAKR